MSEKSEKTFTAEQQAPADAVYAELPDPAHRGPVGTGSYFDSFTADQMRDFADRTHALRMEQAAPKAAAGGVLDDTALLDGLALAGPTSICVVIDRPHDSEVEVATDDVTCYGKTLREALDATIAAQGDKA